MTPSFVRDLLLAPLFLLVVIGQLLDDAGGTDALAAGPADTPPS
ncbi:MAG TPA: hypothetical protein VM183_20600 [Burkholderiales bacterium]|nr:hypothetical protein [Burkholderiales bacterium]